MVSAATSMRDNRSVGKDFDVKKGQKRKTETDRGKGKVIFEFSRWYGFLRYDCAAFR